VLKTTWLSAHVQNHVSLEWDGKSVTMIVLSDHDFPLRVSNFGDLAAFRATFSHSFTAHVQQWLFVSFQLKFWHRHSIPWPRFPYIFWQFEDIFCWFLHSICWMSTILLVYWYTWPTDLESVTCFTPHHENFHRVWIWYDQRCLVIAFLPLIQYVTLWPSPLTFWPWSVVIHGGLHDPLLH